MKNFYIISVAVLLSLCGKVHAQTLKNIHRHNQPVLRIPTHLIDKVETADVQGTPHLRVIQFNGYVSEIPLAQIDSITHSEGEAVDPAQLGNLRTASVMGVVTGPTGAPEMNAIVRSPYGGEETRTDPNGVFFLNNILVYDKLGYITITKPGFHQGSRSFLPLETGSNRVNVQLLPMTESGSFNATSGGTVSSGLLQLNFPANAVTLNGQPYTGTVNVFAAALDPSSTSMFDQMPGELLGGMNDSLRLLRSFGMASVELRDANMNELQLDTNVAVAMIFNIPPSLQAEAPATIDWWSFDEDQGIWMHEGVAQKQGNQYIGQASHFSWWNCDVPQNFNDFHGSVNTSDGTPISDAQVNVVSPTMGTAVTYSNSEGLFTGRVPKNQELTLNFLLLCDTYNDWILVNTEVISSDTTSFSEVFEISSLDERYPISGSILTCTGVPVEAGYVKLGNKIAFSENGVFEVLVCSLGEYTIRAFNISNPDTIQVSDVLNINVDETGIDVGGILTCTAAYGSIADASGHIYATGFIGDQNWMLENLRTINYSNGDPIPNEVVANWSIISGGAWTHYNNDVTYEDIFGKIYNQSAVSDLRNVCPIGWHVPSIDEWNILVSYLGGSQVAGGKLKSINYWTEPNIGATNESGFSALPGGAAFISSFDGLLQSGNWWANNGSGVLQLNYTDSNTMVNGMLFQALGGIGASIRCVQD